MNAVILLIEFISSEEIIKIFSQKNIFANIFVVAESVDEIEKRVEELSVSSDEILIVDDYHNPSILADKLGRGNAKLKIFLFSKISKNKVFVQEPNKKTKIEAGEIYNLSKIA